MRENEQSSGFGSDGSNPHHFDNPVETHVALSSLRPHGGRSLAGVATRAFWLGGVFLLSAGAVVHLLVGESTLWRVPFFFGALALFHFLEFWTTAAYNTHTAGTDAFLLTANWPSYAVAHTAATVEALLFHYFYPGYTWQARLLPQPEGAQAAILLGLVFVAVGQAVRSLAMCHAGPSFNHQLQKTRAESHLLVTGGVYAVMRHPSYFGFFWWAVGTQLLLGNIVCLIGYALVLGSFFKRRIRMEEKFLVKFFGDEYMRYRERVGTLMPMVS